MCQGFFPDVDPGLGLAPDPAPDAYDDDDGDDDGRNDASSRASPPAAFELPRRHWPDLCPDSHPCPSGEGRGMWGRGGDGRTERLQRVPVYLDR